MNTIIFNMVLAYQEGSFTSSAGKSFSIKAARGGAAASEKRSNGLNYDDEHILHEIEPVIIDLGMSFDTVLLVYYL